MRRVKSGRAAPVVGITPARPVGKGREKLGQTNSTEAPRNQQQNALRALFDRKPVAYYPDLADALDSVAAAIFLQELCHWERWSRDGWVFRTQDEIKEATALKRSAQEGARKLLKKMRVVEEKLRGVPARLHYRVDHQNLSAILAIQIAESRILDCAEPADKIAENPQSIDTGKDAPEDAESSPNGEGEPAEPAAGVPEDSRPIALEKYVTDRVYDAMREAKMRLPNADYRYHLGRAKDMLAKDEPTEDEIEALPAAFVRLFTIKGKADAPAALVELRRQAARGAAMAEGNGASGASTTSRTAGYEWLFGDEAPAEGAAPRRREDVSDEDHEMRVSMLVKPYLDVREKLGEDEARDHLAESLRSMFKAPWIDDGYVEAVALEAKERIEKATEGSDDG